MENTTDKRANRLVAQCRYIDDNEGTMVQEFLLKLFQKYKLSETYPEVEIRYRAVNYGLIENHITDDKIAQLVVDNRLVAMAFLRRDDWNHTEVTYVIVDEALRKCKEFKDLLDNKKMSLAEDLFNQFHPEGKTAKQRNIDEALEQIKEAFSCGKDSCELFLDWTDLPDDWVVFPETLDYLRENGFDVEEKVDGNWMPIRYAVVKVKR